MNWEQFDTETLMISKQFFDEERYDEALSLLQGCPKDQIENPLLKIPWVEQMAHCLHALGKYEEEEILRVECLELCTQIAKTQIRRSTRLVILEQYANCLMAQAKFEQAVPVCWEGLHMSITRFGADHAASFIRVRSYVHCLYATERNADADDWYDALIKTGKRLWGELPHGSVIRLLQSLALYFHSQGKLEQCEPFSKRALALMVESVRLTAAKLKADPYSQMLARSTLRKLSDLASYAEELGLEKQCQGVDKVISMMRERLSD